MTPFRPLPLLLLLVILIIATGCIGKQNIDGGVDVGIVYSGSASNSDACRISDYGNGVLFFGCTGGSFASGLSQYIEKENVTITSIAPVPNAAAYNGLTGYIVVVKHK